MVLYVNKQALCKNQLQFNKISNVTMAIKILSLQSLQIGNEVKNIQK